MNVGIIGLGTVTQGFLEILKEKNEWLQEQYGESITIVAIKDIQKGNKFNSKGIDIDHLLKKVNNNETLTDGSLSETTSIASLKEVDLIIEATYSDYKTGDPAYTFIKNALKNNKHVITTNKGPVALHYSELNHLAKKNNVAFCYEGTVLSGTPTFSLIDECLTGNNIIEIRGILNGTSNYILTEISKGESFDNALNLAQSKGYAEADPTNDVKGYDARGKIAILAHKVFGIDLDLNSIPTTGIDNITKEKFHTAKKENKNIRLIGSLKKVGTQLQAKVEPETLEQKDPLSTINGVTNAIEITTSFLGKIVITGPGAGKLETGYSVFSDVITILKSKK
ncbi:homoserine dehydrogenase [Tenacibaculum sp. 190524A02b]|uniref:homoserine dehydrogenase n=1 Tax=Tenacibaculum vairaonense TaxID=3137860 RepID=UPI0031FB29C7